MALLSQMIRASAITGRPDAVHAWFADRQGGRWADQMIRSAMPRPERERRRKELEDLHEQGIVTDAELTQLRARAGL